MILSKSIGNKEKVFSMILSKSIGNKEKEFSMILSKSIGNKEKDCFSQSSCILATMNLSFLWHQCIGEHNCYFQLISSNVYSGICLIEIKSWHQSWTEAKFGVGFLHFLIIIVRSKPTNPVEEKFHSSENDDDAILNSFGSKVALTLAFAF